MLQHFTSDGEKHFHLNFIAMHLIIGQMSLKFWVLGRLMLAGTYFVLSAVVVFPVYANYLNVCAY